MHRILTYGPGIAEGASEQEFQSIQNRPAFGLDQRVARLVLATLVDAAADRGLTYSTDRGTRNIDADLVCVSSIHFDRSVSRLTTKLSTLCTTSSTGYLSFDWPDPAATNESLRRNRMGQLFRRRRAASIHR